jgi:exopolysaccharide biosynthesis polyprenyl glycosylphosphotransferase
MSNHQGKHMIPESVVPHPTAISEVRNTAIIGLNRYGVLAYNRVKEQSKSRENLVGLIDVRSKKIELPRKYKNVKYLGLFNDFRKMVEVYQISHVVIAIDTEDISHIHQIIDTCRKEKVDYELAPEMQDIIYGHTIHQIFKDLKIQKFPSPRQLMDSICSLSLMLMFMPLFSMTALLIKLNSNGPVLYSQERVGLDGRIFRIFKFRTMFMDAEKLSGPVLASKNDPRITGIGRILRKARIDEIPQLINVLIGDMSFIGPRPERPYFVEKYRQEIPMYKNRLRIKPGITGLAQVTTGYDEDLDDVRKKLSYDLEYLENKNSLKMNLSIILKTVMVVLTGKGH